MSIWSAEIKEIQILLNSFKGQFPDLEKELKPLITSEDSNVVLLYSRRCLEVIVTELCEIELKRPRKTEPLKGIIDKLNSEEKVPFNIVTSMHSLNSLSTFGTHPKDFDQEQVKPVLNNLAIIVRWYLKYRETQSKGKVPPDTQKELDRTSTQAKGKTLNKTKKILIYSFAFLIVVAAILVVLKFIVLNRDAEKSIAVLPFRNDSADSTTTYFINGVMEELLNNLMTIKDLRVISRSSVEQYRDEARALPKIARELGVNYILEGSGQRYGNTLRMRVQLIQVPKERHLFGKSYQQELPQASAFFELQSQIAQEIAKELNATITPQEKQLIEKLPTNNLEAYDVYLKGQFYLYKATPNDLDTAMQYFELAKEKDPEFALAYVGIGNVWLFRQQFLLASPDEAGPKLMAAINRALELDSTIAEVHYTLGLMNVYGLWDWKAGEEEFKKAIAINPNYAEAHALYSHLLNILGRPEEAMKHIELALKLDPHNPLIKVWYSQDLLFVHRYDDCISVSREVFQQNPTMFIALDALFQALHLAGRHEEAFEVLKFYFCNFDLYKDFNNVFDQYTKLSYAGTLNLEGDTLLAQSKSKSISPIDFTYLFLFAGNKERALECLELSYEMHDSNIPYITRPTYDILRDEPRFQDLLRKLNLPFNN
jgi:TolB-like protein